MKTKLFVLISTIDHKILNLKYILQPYNQNIYYIISHQVTQKIDKHTSIFIDTLRERKNVKYSMLKGKGVAINRNNTLKFIESSAICLIMDDDVLICKNAFQNVIKAFYDHADADFISFKILDLDGNDYKSYPKKKQWHTLQTLSGVGTTEIAFKSDLILNKNVRFDERFGPGVDKYPLGEDFIFAMDLYHLNVKMLFLPIPIVKHPKGSTGGSLDEKIIFARGAVFARVYGAWSYLLDIVFTLRHKKMYHDSYTMRRYLKLMLLGSYNFLQKEKK